MTFDGWDTQYYGDCLSYGQDSLMHFRTKGSKNGVRRYQMPDGTWTPLGLKERKAREGWGERRAARKEARAQRHEERRAARAAVRSANLERARQYKADKAEEKRLRNPKRMTDEELNRGIERLKKEEEFRELNTPAIVRTGRTIVESYFKLQEARQKQQDEALKRKERMSNIQTRQIDAVAKLIEAKAKNKEQINEMISNVPFARGATKRKATAEYYKEKKAYKQFTSNNTVRGAIQKTISNILSKEGNNLVKEMSDESVSKRTKNRIKNVGSKIRNARNERLYGRSGNPTGGQNLNY